jgi:competence protein ComEA
VPVLSASALDHDPKGVTVVQPVLGLDHGPDLHITKRVHLRGNWPSQDTGEAHALAQLSRTDHLVSPNHRARAGSNHGSEHASEAIHHEPGSRSPSRQPGTPAATTTAPSQAGLIDINTASKEQLDALPQIGSARAEAIIKGRPCKAKSDLVDRKIIPENAYKAIQHKIVARQKS